MVRIIDVSNVNGHINWALVHQHGIRGAFVKASEGATYTDALFQENRQHANAYGIRVGAYHFARPDLNPPHVEADHFCRLVGKLSRRDLRPVLDYEHDTHLTTAQTLAWITTWNHRVQHTLGVWPIFYSYPALIDHLHLPRPVGGGLWLASYGINDGHPHRYRVPRPWKHAVAHQYTSRGRILGVPAAVDVSETRSMLPLLAHPVRGL